MKNIICLSLISLFLFSCTHTIDLRSSHFLTPATSQNQWSGSISLSGASPTKITLVDDVTGNPPVTDPVNINRDVTLSDVFGLSLIDLNFNLSLYPSLEFIMSNYTYGLKWQFLNHGQTSNAWMASIMGAMGSKETSHSSNNDRSESDVKTTRYGLSVGYAFDKAMPYASYINEQHKATTHVNNTNGRFDYENEGRHEYFTLGVSTVGPGLKAAAEYNMINIAWDNEKAYQNTFGLLLGFEW